MALSTIEQLTVQFYEWERRGRGWHVFNSPVDLEPPFDPLSYHVQPRTSIDDGVSPGVFDGLKKIFGSKQKELPPAPAYEMEAIDYVPGGTLHVFSVSLPKGQQVDVSESEQLLLMLSTCKDLVSFEIIATSRAITVQCACREPDDILVRSQLKAYFPACIIGENQFPDGILDESQSIFILDLGLKEEFMRPLQLADSFGVDPLTGLFGMMEQLQGQEQCAVQILFKGAVDPWAGSIIASVTDNEGDSFFLDAPEMPKMAREKISSPLFGVTIRVIGQAREWTRAQSLAKGIGSTLIQASQSLGNSLIFLSNGEYPDDVHREDVMLRQSHRMGMLLNSQELVQLAHLPSSSVISSKLGQNLKKTKIAPAITQGGDLVLGTNIHQGEERKVSVSPGIRLRHTHIIGATGTGKSTLMLQCILQDITQGKGIAVLDPHGDLIETILRHVPPHRISGIVLVDPSDALFPTGFNILSANSDIEKDVLSSDLVAVFRRLSTSWGDQMNSVFANAILAFLENSIGGTFMDLRRFLVEKSFRDTYLKTVTDPSIVYYWQKEYPLVKSASIGPILTRLDTFLRPKLIRNMVGQNKRLDFENILNTGKILLVKLSQGLIGDENSYLLGTLFVSKIYQAAMARQAMGKETRSDFFLYVDEFQNFITPSMSQILAGARKYHLGLILAHQDMQQLLKEDANLASAVISNAGTRICFRLGDTDAKRFEDGFAFFDAQDLQNLETGEAIVRVERPEYDFNLTVSQFDERYNEASETVREKVIEQSREKYGTPREAVEATFEYFSPEPEKEERGGEPTRKPVEEKRAKPEVKMPAIDEVEKPKQEKQELAVQELDPETSRRTIDNLVKQKELSQHRYLQTLIKRMAEARGYKAAIEEPTPDGQGRVDVSLERNGKRIACEIGVTTSKQWEVHNIEKCLNAGYEIVVAVPIDTRAAEVMKRQIKDLDTQFHAQVFVMEADELFHYLDTEIAKEATTEKRVKGYRIKVEYDAVSEETMKLKRDSITKVVLDSIKKEKK